MQASDDRHFVGAMFPEIFLDTFMKVADLPAAPAVSYSGAPDGGSVREVCRRLIQAVEKSKVCPGLRLFAARTTRQRAKQEMPRVQQERTRDSNEEVPQETKENWPYPCPAMAARTEPKSRRKTKRRNLVEYYDFSTVVLDIEVDCRPEADPFVDPPESTASRATSAALSPLRSPPPPEPSSNPHPLPSRLPSPSGGHVRAPCTPPQKTSPAHFPSEGAGGAKSVGSEPVGGPVPPPLNSPAAEAGPSKARRDGSPASAVSTYEPFPNPSKEGAAFRRSMISHVNAVFARQHRTFLFQLVIVDRWARFVRWDRSGAVGSERFDYVWEPQVLAEFFWRFAHMTGEERGFDSSAKLASKQEAALFNAAVREYLGDMEAGMKNGKPVRRLPDAERTLDDTGTYPVWKLHVVDAVTRKSTDLIVKRPFSGHFQMFGRATRAYIAFDLAERRLVFLKDTWRLEHPTLRAESRTYRELKRRGVSHIPEMLYGGDVRDTKRRLQQTATQIYAADEHPWRISEGQYDTFVHHRIVQEICYPLTSALNEREFTQALHDALLAIADAYRLASIIHRDISFGNIMISLEGRGVLNDWDHAGKKDIKVRGGGTWAFMSIPVLKYRRHTHDVVDDLESVFWVLLYGALKYYVSNSESDLIRETFDQQYINRKGRRLGGEGKFAFIFGDALATVEFTSPLLGPFLNDLKSAWWTYYVAERHDLEETPETYNIIYSMLDRAVDPQFWIDKFSQVLQQFDCQSSSSSCEDGNRPSGPSAAPTSHIGRAGSPLPELPALSDGNAQPCSGTKRKADEHEHSPGRRKSKRLRQLPP